MSRSSQLGLRTRTCWAIRVEQNVATRIGNLDDVVRKACLGIIVGWLVLLSGPTTGTAQEAEGTSDRTTDPIQAVLDEQVAAWNEGDLDRFMDTYWRSNELSFSSGGQTTRGWDAARRRYHDRYPNREAMGRLAFDGLEIHRLGEQAAWVLGRWRLQRDGETLQGNFTLVLRQIEGSWKIVHDHTSLDDSTL